MPTKNFPALNCTLSNFVRLQKLGNALYSMLFLSYELKGWERDFVKITDYKFDSRLIAWVSNKALWKLSGQ